MGCPSHVEHGATLVFSVTTHDPDTGASADATALPAYRIYNAAGTQVYPAAGAAGEMGKVDDDNTTGAYIEAVECSTANGFVASTSYTIVVTATVATVAGTIALGFIDITKTGYSLAATGLDAITVTEPSAKPTTFPGWIMWLVQRFRRSAKTPTAITVKTEAGATVTTQAITDDGAGTETLGAPS